MNVRRRDNPTQLERPCLTAKPVGAESDSRLCDDHVVATSDSPDLAKDCFAETHFSVLENQDRSSSAFIYQFKRITAIETQRYQMLAEEQYQPACSGYTYPNNTGPL